MLILSSNIMAAPFLVSDPTIQTVTHCGIYMDDKPVVDVPVEVVTAGDRCKYDLSTLTEGSHTVTATFVNQDPVWGRVESASSAPFVFVRPTLGGPGGTIGKPVNIHIILN